MCLRFLKLCVGCFVVLCGIKINAEKWGKRGKTMLHVHRKFKRFQRKPERRKTNGWCFQMFIHNDSVMAFQSHVAQEIISALKDQVPQLGLTVLELPYACKAIASRLRNFFFRAGLASLLWPCAFGLGWSEKSL